MDRIRDRIWIWGHPANSLKGAFGIKDESFVSPVDGMKELGARNIFYVPMNHPADRQLLSAEMDEECRSFGWSIENREQAEALPEMKNKYSHLTIGIFDDFFCPENSGNNMTVHTVESLKQTKKLLNDAGIEMWAVYYERQIDLDISPYLDCFDGFSFWFWKQPDKDSYESTIQRFFEKTPGKRRLIGCYLYDFGRECACVPESVTYELSRGTDFMRTGLCEGIILHTNAVSHMGLAAYSTAIEWMSRYGDSVL